MSLFQNNAILRALPFPRTLVGLGGTLWIVSFALFIRGSFHDLSNERKDFDEYLVNLNTVVSAVLPLDLLYLVHIENMFINISRGACFVHLLAGNLFAVQALGSGTGRPGVLSVNTAIGFAMQTVTLVLSVASVMFFFVASIAVVPISVGVAKMFLSGSILTLTALSMLVTAWQQLIWKHEAQNGSV